MPNSIFWTSYTFFFSEQRVSKGEHTYGWSSASGGKMQGYQGQAKSFAAVSILMLVKFY
jgi:hypothetical protein